MVRSKFKFKFLYFKVLFFFFLSFLFIFLALHIFLSLNSNYKTEIAYRSVVSKKLNSHGIIFKNEKVLDYCKNDEIMKNIYKNGSHVAANSEIAKKYYKELDIQNLEKIEKIDEKIESLKETQKSIKNSDKNFNDLNSQIYKSYFNFFDALKQNDLQSCFKLKNKIIDCLNKKQILVGKVKNFDKTIDNLKEEKKSIAKLISSKPQIVKTPISGYICDKIDGFEEQCSLEAMDNLTVDELERIYDNCNKNKNNFKLGNKIIYNPRVFFKAFLPSDWILDCDVGSKCVLNMNQTGEEIDAELVKLNLGKNNKKGLATFELSCMTDKLASLRTTDVEIKFKNYSGLKINKLAIRKNEKNQTGVYVKIGSIIKFKLVNILTENDDFVISKIHDDDNSYVRELDEVIVKGKDLYDKKRIK